MHAKLLSVNKSKVGLPWQKMTSCAITSLTLRLEDVDFHNAGRAEDAAFATSQRDQRISGFLERTQMIQMIQMIQMDVGHTDLVW
jgi:hypothetical protein